MPTAMGDALRLLDDGLRVLAAFHGLTHENMTRNFGWSFLDMGRRLARALATSPSCCSASSASARSGDDETGSLLFTLELADSFITYRSRYRLAPMLPLVLDLLLIDESNPRSVAFQLAALAQHIDTLPQSGRRHAGAPRSSAWRCSLLTQMRLADVAALAKAGGGRRASRPAEAAGRAGRGPAGPLRRHRPALLRI